MVETPLQRIESGLAHARAALLRAELEAMHAHLVATLDALAEVTRAGLVPRQQRADAPWDAARALQLVWELLAGFHAAGCHVFPYAGTLLGLQRDGHLLAGDKDADLATWLEDFALAGRLLQQWGLQRATDVPPFANMATYVEPRTGYSIDLFGLYRNPHAQCTEGGAWFYGKPASHQRLLLLPWLELVARDAPAGPVWWPAPAEALLEAFYGDWRRPDPEWDTLVSNRALHEINLSWWCWSLQRLVQCWLKGDLAKTRRLLEQIVARGGEQPFVATWREGLA